MLTKVYSYSMVMKVSTRRMEDMTTVICHGKDESACRRARRATTSITRYLRSTFPPLTNAPNEVSEIPVETSSSEDLLEEELQFLWDVLHNTFSHPRWEDSEL